jgi:hypothetical protein
MKTTGETVSATVNNMLAVEVSEDRGNLPDVGVRAVYRKKLQELARHLGVSYAYMPRKLKSGTWTMDDLDGLANFFKMWPADFVPGPEDEKME